MKHFITQHDKQRTFMSVAILLFAALPLMLVFPITISSAHATEDSSNSEVALNVDSVINISSPSSAAFDCAPGTATIPSSLCTTVATIGVSTNNASGYTLQMSITPGYPTDLTNSSVSPSATLSAINQAYVPANFPANSWGYTGGTDQSSKTGGYNCVTNYCPVLAYQANESNYSPNYIIKQTDAPATVSNTNITFGAKIDISKPFGAYSTSVTFTAVANHVPGGAPITDGMNLKDVTSDMCIDTELYSTSNTIYTLVDSRNNINYTVAKLQDGNCWMTQNLALGSSSPTVLTQADSNVGPSGFTLPASVSEGDWAESTTDPEFFDYAGNYPTQQATNRYGNLYNWAAATAGSTRSSGNADYDICPKNWHLPTFTEYSNLMSAYPALSSYPSHASQFTSPPLSLVFAGQHDRSGLIHEETYGTWWSSTAADASEACNFYIYIPGGDVSDSMANLYCWDFGKDLGVSVRCLIPGT
ncbi:hypothetical protein IKF33_02260 [Candidatus Saccharibacteria bacterium]|nr:hypothetical protein [Candidatus Saccharibacteria bacterium]